LESAYHTQKSLELLKRIVLGGLLLGHFIGNSTTVNGDKRQEFVGIDKEKRYLGLPVKRFKNLNEYKISSAETYK
jgi:hypothetical protein